MKFKVDLMMILAASGIWQWLDLIIHWIYLIMISRPWWRLMMVYQQLMKFGDLPKNDEVYWWSTNKWWSLMMICQQMMNSADDGDLPTNDSSSFRWVAVFLVWFQMVTVEKWHFNPATIYLIVTWYLKFSQTYETWHSSSLYDWYCDLSSKRPLE